MGACCSKPRVKDEEEEEILKKHLITGVEELSSTCLKYDGERFSQKWYTSSVYTDDSTHENFNLVCCKREVSILSKLDHKNIIKFVGVYCKPKNPQPILVSEEVTSNLLCHLDKVDTLENSEKFKFSCGVSDGLAYLHSQRLAHLNLCTKSILLTESLEIKIANFEYASYFLDESVASSSSSGPTRVKFDPWELFRYDDSVSNFLPPQYHKRTYDSVDIYSFGCVVFNIFTLKQPTMEIKSRLEEISVAGVGNLVSKCLCGQIESMQEVNSALNICSKEYFFNVPEESVQKKVFEAEIEVHGEVEMLDQSKNRDTDQDTDRISDVLKSEIETQDKSTQTECHEDAVIPQENLGVQPSEASNSKVETEDKEVQVECTETAIVPVPQGKPVQPSETSKSKVQTEDKGVQIECKEIALIPPRNLQDQEVERLKRENSLLISKLTALEEQSFKFTNAFTTADEGSPIKLRDLYRNMQTNGRPAANRAHKKVYKGISYPILEHTMLAYEEAKILALQEFEIVSDRFNSLFQLKLPDDNPSPIKRDKAMMQSQELLESFHTKPLNEKIYQMLIDKYKALTNQAPDGIPQPVDEYYSSLAKFAWDCVARPIPMILSKDTQKFDGDIHETKDGDGDDGDDSNNGKFVSYIYPVLFTSNSWPREIAMKGKVNVLDLQDSIV